MKEETSKLDHKNLWIFAVLIISFGALFYSFNLESSNEISGMAVVTLGSSNKVNLQSGAEKGCVLGSQFITGIYVANGNWQTNNKLDAMQCTNHGITLPNPLTRALVVPSSVSRGSTKEFKCAANYVAVTIKKTDNSKVSTITNFGCQQIPSGYSLINSEYFDLKSSFSGPLVACPPNKALIGFVIADDGNGDYAKNMICASVDNGQTPGPPSQPTDGTCVNGQFQFITYSDSATTVNGNPSAVLTPIAAWNASIPGASWIWSSGDRVTTQDTAITLQRQFTLPSSISNVAATVKIAADNRYSCKLNDQNVGGDPNDFNFRSGDEDIYNFNSLPVAGTNTFKCDVTNLAVAGSTFSTNPGGLLYKLEISGQCSGAPPTTQCFLDISGTNDKVTLAGTIERSCDPLANEFIDGLYKSTTSDGLTYIDGFRCSTHSLTLPNPTITDTITLPKYWEIQANTEYRCGAGDVMVKIKPSQNGQTFNLFDSFSCIQLPNGYSTANVERTILQAQQGISKANLCPSNKVMIGVKTIGPNQDGSNNHIGEIICANIQKPVAQCSATTTQCNDGIENDNDGKVDLMDAGCANAQDNTEAPNPTCTVDGDCGSGFYCVNYDINCNGATCSKVILTQGKLCQAPQCSDKIDNDNDGKIDFGTGNDLGCASLTDNDETDGSPIPPPPNQTNTTNTSTTDQFPNDSCSFSVLNDKCGYAGCNSDIDGDGYFTDSSTSDQTGKGCDKKRGNVCSALISNDLQGLVAPTIPTGGVISTEGIEIPVNGYFELFADAYTNPQPSAGWPKIVKFIAFDTNTKQLTVQINNMNSDFASSSTSAPHLVNIVSGGETFKAFVQANGKLTVDLDADGTITVNKKIPVPLTSCTTQTGNTCEITSVTWLASTDVKEGEQVQLQVNTNALCNGKTVVFNIYEHDFVGSNDPANINPAPVVVQNGIAIGTWIAEYNDGTLGNPMYNYYFQANVENSQMASSDLKINQNTGSNTCGNNVVEGTEDCFTCSKDAGCLSGQLCCVNQQGFASCSTSCGTQQPNNGNNVCDTGSNLQTNQKENCGVTACNGRNAGCVEGNICAIALCACNPTPDNICSKDNACKTIDPDCDKDGDLKVEGDDNCPAVKNADQADYDLDSIGCKYDFEKTGLHVNPGLNLYCGGDVCDIDDDNDGVCDAGATTSGLLCKGQDNCDGTTFGIEVDANGCSIEQAKCLSAWDCTSVQWSSCDPATRTKTRNIGDCSSYESVVENNLCRCTISPDIDQSCFQALTLPSMETCEVEEVEQQVPFFGLWNFLAVIGMLVVYYSFRRKL